MGQKQTSFGSGRGERGTEREWGERDPKGRQISQREKVKAPGSPSRSKEEGKDRGEE